jgi:signal transduction histidine kinase/ActR/RegA family two-component response regulator
VLLKFNIFVIAEIPGMKKENVCIEYSEYQVKSILCIQIVHQQKLIGSVENFYFSDSFSEQRVSLLTVLSSQMAIAIQNAMYFTQQIESAKTVANLERERASVAEKYRKLQEQFIDRTMHEIRNPLNGLFGNVDMLKSIINDMDTMTENISVVKSKIHQLQDVSDSMEQCINHQKAMADIVLTCSMLEANEDKLQCAPFVPQDMVNNVIAMFKAELSKQNITCTVNAPLSKYYRSNVVGDADRLTQIFVNLLSNAIKFTPVNGKIDVSVEMEDSGKELNFIARIADTGVGINETEMKLIFDRFHQLEKNSTVQYQKGVGLGLYICKKLIELMGGKISVSSTQGVGTIFTFNVHLNKYMEPPVQQVIQSHVAVTCPTSVKLLIVEDNIINQKVLANFASFANYPYTIASCGEEAIQEFEQHSYDCILMDIVMPGINGFEATLKIRELETRFKRKPCVIIGLSGNARHEYYQMAKDVGMNDYLTKPVKKDIVLNIIASYFK